MKLERPAAVALLVVLAVGLAGCTAGNSSFLHPYGTIAASQRRLFFEVIGCMAVVVIPVFILVPLFAWRYRRKNRTAEYRPQWSFSWPLELAIWGVPIAVVAALAFLVITREVPLDPYRAPASSQPPLEIQVIGLDWKWLFIYPEQRVATVGVMAIPTDRPVHFSLTSDTVMQSFFIPSLGSQIYAMAGMVTQLNLQADREGQLRGENSQFNGMGFQNQKFTASVMSAPDFTRWIAKVRQTGSPLDQTAYHVLALQSTAEQARAALGGKGASSPVIFFSEVDPGLFHDVIGKYRAQTHSVAIDQDDSEERK
jgi:cytochrome o ubiquinol oxidase subunit 2